MTIKVFHVTTNLFEIIFYKMKFQKINIFKYFLLKKEKIMKKLGFSIFVLALFTALNLSAQTCEKPVKRQKKSEKMTISTNETKQQLNILGEKLQPCCFEPLTGYTRNGSCETIDNDYGNHVICATVSQEFLDFSKSKGNDLMSSTPYFPGLKAGDKWCLCALRWREALEAGVAPPVNIASTHSKALQFVSLEDLKKHAVR